MNVYTILDKTMESTGMNMDLELNGIIPCVNRN